MMNVQTTAVKEDIQVRLRRIEGQVRGVQRMVDEGDFAAIDPALTPGVRAVLSAEGSVASRNGYGGTAPAAVAVQLAEAKGAAARARGFAQHGR